MSTRLAPIWIALAAALAPSILEGQPTPPAASSHLREEMRNPWTRSNERFIRRWLVLGDIALAPGALTQDALAGEGGEAAVRPIDKAPHKLPDGSTIAWRSVTSWGDATDLSDGKGLKRDVVGYAFTTVQREAAGQVRLSIGSDESIRVWLNGKPVLSRDTRRPLTFDEDQIEVPMQAGPNALLIKLEQHTGPWTFSARVLESGAIPPKVQEIGPSIIESSPALVIQSDIRKDPAEDKVTVQVVAAGGKVMAESIVSRGESAHFDPAAWPDGPYEVRCATHGGNGLLSATHLPWYKGDAMAAARDLIAAAGRADAATPQGFTTKMLADMVKDRLGVQDPAAVTGNPWWAIHSPLMEFAELKLGATAQARPYGFVRLAWRDDIDGSPQYCRAYLPGGYARSRQWPLVLHIHGYNGPNPDYIRWWGVDSRHAQADVEYANHEGVIYLEPHGRGNTTYLGLGDQDIVRVIQLAKEKFNVDPDRVYLIGDSMGGWGTWNVATRHPDLFAAIAPIFGGADYHSTLTEEQLAKLTPLDRFIQDKTSSWSMAESLSHTPILVHHGDVDQSVNVDFSRYGIRLLQRWGYNVRYVEMPGYGHEDLNVMTNIIDWFLQHRRVANPSRVRLRTAELQNAGAWWAKIDQAAAPGQFMLLDAEVAGRNRIRLDTQNIVAVTLSPGAPLIDPSRPVEVVWNGKPCSMTPRDGRLELRDESARKKSRLEKNAKIAGPLGDVFNTPFAIVTGTASADPAMKEICRRKAEAVVNLWKDWQRQPPRIFNDSELTDQDAARYSLVLIGGAEANLITRKLAARLPVEIAPDHIRLGEKSFPVTDARFQMIYPNPLNPERYVYLLAATSAAGMYLWRPEHLRNAEFDFSIEDSRIATGAERVSPYQMRVAGGWFDQRWQVRDDLIYPGDAEARSHATVLRTDRTVDSKTLDAYAGSYQIAPEFVVKVERRGSGIVTLAPNNPVMEMIPVSDTEFIIIEGPVKIVFEKDAGGKVVSFKGWQNGQQFGGKKTN